MLSTPEGRRRSTLAAAVVAISVLVVAGISLAGNRSSAPKGAGSVPAATSTQPEAFALPSLHGGGLVSLANYRGSPVVVNFFASWCSSCKGELPGMAQLSERLKGRVTFIGVDSRENGDGYAMASQFGITWWPLARDIDGVQDSGLHDALKGQGMPITAFYDASGHLGGVSYSALSDVALRDKIQQYFGIAV